MLRQRRETAEASAVAAAQTAPSPDELEAAHRDLLRLEREAARVAAFPTLCAAAEQATAAAEAEPAARAELARVIQESPIGALVDARRARIRAAREFDAALAARVPSVGKLRHTQDADVAAALDTALAELAAVVDPTAARAALDDSHPAHAVDVSTDRGAFDRLIGFLAEMAAPAPLPPGVHLTADAVGPRTARQAIT